MNHYREDGAARSKSSPALSQYIKEMMISQSMQVVADNPRFRSLPGMVVSPTKPKTTTKRIQRWLATSTETACDHDRQISSNPRKPPHRRSSLDDIGLLTPGAEIVGARNLNGTFSGHLEPPVFPPMQHQLFVGTTNTKMDEVPIPPVLDTKEDIQKDPTGTLNTF